MRLATLFLTALLMSPTAMAEKASAESSAGQDDQAGDPIVSVGGYVRARYSKIFEGDDGPDFVGLNDGFSLDNARLVVDMKKGKLTSSVSIDGAVDRRSAANTSVGRVDVGLKDAWIAYPVCAHFDLKVGQFKPPFDAEEMQSTAAMIFIDRSVESRGVQGVEGFNVGGLSLERQAGILASGRFKLSPKWALSYGLSVTNGSGANHPKNDNDQLAYTGRLYIEQGDNLVLGGGVHLNRRTNGEPPDLLVDDHLSWVVDLTYERQMGAVGILLSGQFMQREIQSVDVPTEPTVTARGYHAAAGLRLPGGYVVAYRYATLDPTAEFEAEDPTVKAVLEVDAVTLHTAGVGYEMDDVPLKVQLNYTLAMEQDERAVDNDRLDLLFQAVF